MFVLDDRIKDELCLRFCRDVCGLIVEYTSYFVDLEFFNFTVGQSDWSWRRAIPIGYRDYFTIFQRILSSQPIRDFYQTRGIDFEPIRREVYAKYPKWPMADRPMDFFKDQEDQEHQEEYDSRLHIADSNLRKRAFMILSKITDYSMCSPDLLQIEIRREMRQVGERRIIEMVDVFLAPSSSGSTFWDFMNAIHKLLYDTDKLATHISLVLTNPILSPSSNILSVLVQIT
jgi:hypothetical protein